MTYSRRIFQKWKRFLRNTAGVAAIEFALVLPVLLIVFAGIVEFSNYTTIDRRTQLFAERLALILAQFGEISLSADVRDELLRTYAAVNPTATEEDALISGDILIPGLAASVVSISFVPDDPACVTDCVFQPQAVWKWSASNGVEGAKLRECSVPIHDGSGWPADGGIPSGIVGPTPVVAIQLVYRYRPLIHFGPLKEILIRAEAFQTIRSGDAIEHFDPKTGAYRRCV